MTKPELLLQRKLLEHLVVGNHHLERLEALLRKFNLFVAMDAVRHEIRHSNFLAYLLDPHKNHGLGSLFLKRFLQAAVARHALPGFEPVDIEVWQPEATQVLREWQNIDITLRDDASRIAVIIENKIDSVEHSNQLQRYLEVCENDFRGWTIVGIYLTPDGEPPSDPRYAAMSYASVCDVLEKLTTQTLYAISDEVRLGLQHYAEMLRRYVVAESKISDLCRQIYQQHREALDLIYEHRPDPQSAIQQLLESLIKEHPELELDTSSKSLVRFWVKRVDFPSLRRSENWTASKRILLFEFYNGPRQLKLWLYIGPGPVEFRRRLYDMAREKKPLKPLDVFGSKWNAIFSRQFLEGDSYDKPQEEIEEAVKTHWQHFLTADMPEIITILESKSWLLDGEGQAKIMPSDHS